MWPSAPLTHYYPYMCTAELISEPCQLQAVTLGQDDGIGRLLILSSAAWTMHPQAAQGKRCSRACLVRTVSGLLRLAMSRAYACWQMLTGQACRSARVTVCNFSLNMPLAAEPPTAQDLPTSSVYERQSGSSDSSSAKADPSTSSGDSGSRGTAGQALQDAPGTSEPAQDGPEENLVLKCLVHQPDPVSHVDLHGRAEPFQASVQQNQRQRQRREACQQHSAPGICRLPRCMVNEAAVDSAQASAFWHSRGIARPGAGRQRADQGCLVLSATLATVHMASHVGCWPHLQCSAMLPPRGKSMKSSDFEHPSVSAGGPLSVKPSSL